MKKSPKEICHLTSVHIPFDTRIFHKECKTLYKAGYRVHLVCVHNKDEIIDNVYIHALSEHKGIFKRILTIVELYRKALHIDAQVYHFHDPELIFTGLLLKLKGKNVIYDVHEDYFKSFAVKKFIVPLLRKPTAWLFKNIENFTARFFYAVIVANPPQTEKFKRINKNTILIQNFVNIDEFSIENYAPWESRLNAVFYLGNIVINRGLNEMITAIELARKKVPAELYLAGKFSPNNLENEIKKKSGDKYVNYVGFLSRKELVELIDKMKIGIAVLRPVGQYMDSYPTKIFEYMAAGLPVITSDFPLYRDIFEPLHCCIFVDPLNPQEIADAIVYLLKNPEKAETMGKRGREAVESSYRWDKEEEKLLSLYADLQ